MEKPTANNWGCSQRSLAWQDQYLRGARDLLLALHDRGMLNDSNVKQIGKSSKETKIYNDAIYTMLVQDKTNIHNFLYGDDICFYDHERDKKDRLIRLKARI